MFYGQGYSKVVFINDFFSKMFYLWITWYKKLMNVNSLLKVLTLQIGHLMDIAH